MERVHLVVSHHLDELAQVVHRDVLTTSVNHETTKGILWTVGGDTLWNGVRLCLFAQLEKGACAPKCARRLGSGECNVVGNVEVIAFGAESVSFRCWSKTSFGEDEVTFLWFSTC